MNREVAWALILVPNKPYGFCGRKARRQKKHKVSICVRVDVLDFPQSSGAVWKARLPSWAPVLMSLTITVSVDVKQH